MTRTKTLTFGLLLVGAALGASLVATPTASAGNCIGYAYVPTQGWTCVPPEPVTFTCIGYVYEPVTGQWHCIPKPGVHVPDVVVPPLPGGHEGCVAYVYVATQGWTCVPPEEPSFSCFGYVYDPITHTWRCIPEP